MTLPKDEEQKLREIDEKLNQVEHLLIDVNVNLEALQRLYSEERVKQMMLTFKEDGDVS